MIEGRRLLLKVDMSNIGTSKTSEVAPASRSAGSEGLKAV